MKAYLKREITLKAMDPFSTPWSEPKLNKPFAVNAFRTQFNPPTPARVASTPLCFPNVRLTKPFPMTAFPVRCSLEELDHDRDVGE